MAKENGGTLVPERTRRGSLDGVVRLVSLGLLGVETTGCDWKDEVTGNYYPPDVAPINVAIAERRIVLPRDFHHPVSRLVIRKRLTNRA